MVGRQVEVDGASWIWFLLKNRKNRGYGFAGGVDSRPQNGKKRSGVVNGEGDKRLAERVGTVCRIKSEFRPNGNTMSSASVEEN